MVEDFLHFVWEHKLFNLSALHTTEGEAIIIHHSGFHNFSSGPDFSEAQITIGETKWAGSVEIHLRSSDWQKHGHSADAAYNNVVLHVVFENDQSILNDENQPIPALELKGRISANVIRKYESLKQSKAKIPCESSIGNIDEIRKSSWLNRVIIERLERKTMDVGLIFNQTGQNWQQTYYSLMAACLGQNNNKLPMLELARKVPYNVVSKMVGDSLKIEALILGAGGFLNQDAEGEYANALQEEYRFQKKKHALVEVSQGWKTGRIRPENMPVRRLVQLAGMVEFMPKAMHELLANGAYPWHEKSLAISPFWQQNYSLTKPSAKRLNASISQSLSDLLTINGHAPFLFFYAQMTGEQELKDKALSLLESLKPESNSILKTWTQLGLVPKNALDSQALIELEQQYCTHKKCVNCNLEKWIISSL